ncbi:4Fe-4S binding protein [Adlercreutzia sp. ZJ304]|uniref:4Fe-4S binding protein n=1 Tax=Adlercreutzia sp. ZJ304 TaxID=2709791 RepID=UPI001F151A29|nr:4Fe-4S binding protein [Adlercreutzia sp. ZJ304]
MAEQEQSKVGKKAKAKWTIARRCVQVAMLVVFCLPLLIAGWSLFGGSIGEDVAVSTPAQGIFFGSLAASEIAGISILDPFATLQAALAAKTFSLGMLLGILPVLIVYGVVRGRAFCGWVCPVNLLCEGVDWLRNKLGISVSEHVIPRQAKIYVALGILVLSAIFAFPVFEAFSPIAAINRGLLFGSLAGSFTLIAIVIAELFWAKRVWCRAICPVGGLYQVIGKVGLVNVRIDHEKCIDCDVCKKACLADPVILNPALEGVDVIVRAGDCMACGACVDACPTGALRMGVGRARKPQSNQKAKSEGKASDLANKEVIVETIDAASVG